MANSNSLNSQVDLDPIPISNSQTHVLNWGSYYFLVWISVFQLYSYIIARGLSPSACIFSRVKMRKQRSIQLGRSDCSWGMVSLFHLIKWSLPAVSIFSTAEECDTVEGSYVDEWCDTLQCVLSVNVIGLFRRLLPLNGSSDQVTNVIGSTDEFQSLDQIPISCWSITSDFSYCKQPKYKYRWRSRKRHQTSQSNF